MAKEGHGLKTMGRGTAANRLIDTTPEGQYMCKTTRVTILIVCGVASLVACVPIVDTRDGTTSNIWLKQTTNARGGGGGTDGGGMGR